MLHARVLACWTLRVGVGTVATLTLGLGNSESKRMCKSQISSLLRQYKAEISLRLEEVIRDAEV